MLELRKLANATSQVPNVNTYRGFITNTPSISIFVVVSWSHQDSMVPSMIKTYHNQNNLNNTN